MLTGITKDILDAYTSGKSFAPYIPKYLMNKIMAVVFERSRPRRDFGKWQAEQEQTVMAEVEQYIIKKLSK